MHKPTSYFLPAETVEQLHGLTQDGETPRDALVRLVAQADAGWSEPLTGFAGGTDKGAYPAAGIGLTSAPRYLPAPRRPRSTAGLRPLLVDRPNPRPRVLAVSAVPLEERLRRLGVAVCRSVP